MLLRPVLTIISRLPETLQQFEAFLGGRWSQIQFPIRLQSTLPDFHLNIRRPGNGLPAPRSLSQTFTCTSFLIRFKQYHFPPPLQHFISSTCSTSWWCQTALPTVPTWQPSWTGVSAFNITFIESFQIWVSSTDCQVQKEPQVHEQASYWHQFQLKLS